MQSPLTYFTSVAKKSVWAVAVKSVWLINTRSIVEARVTVAFVDICKKRKNNSLKTQVNLNSFTQKNSLQIACYCLEPVSHRLPINPSGQLQLKLFSMSTHVPLLKQGLLSHSLMSATIVTATNHKHI